MNAEGDVVPNECCGAEDALTISARNHVQDAVDVCVGPSSSGRRRAPLLGRLGTHSIKSDCRIMRSALRKQGQCR
jgi:hypothetical protein